MLCGSSAVAVGYAAADAHDLMVPLRSFQVHHFLTSLCLATEIRLIFVPGMGFSYAVVIVVLSRGTPPPN